MLLMKNKRLFDFDFIVGKNVINFHVLDKLYKKNNTETFKITFHYK